MDYIIGSVESGLRIRASTKSHKHYSFEQVPAAPDAEQVQRLASENAKASLQEIRKRSEEEKAVWQREKTELQQQVNKLQVDNALLQRIRVQQNDQINKLLITEKMSAKQATQELDVERLGKEGTLQQLVTEQTKQRLSDGNKE
jgi:hypothetical protein